MWLIDSSPCAGATSAHPPARRIGWMSCPAGSTHPPTSSSHLPNHLSAPTHPPTCEKMRTLWPSGSRRLSRRSSSAILPQSRTSSSGLGKNTLPAEWIGWMCTYGCSLSVQHLAAAQARPGWGRTRCQEWAHLQITTALQPQRQAHHNAPSKGPVTRSGWLQTLRICGGVCPQSGGGVEHFIIIIRFVFLKASGREGGAPAGRQGGFAGASICCWCFLLAAPCRTSHPCLVLLLLAQHPPASARC